MNRLFVFIVCAALSAWIGFADSATTGWILANNQLTEQVSDGATPWVLRSTTMTDGTLCIGYESSESAGNAIITAGSHTTIDLSAPVTDANAATYSITKIGRHSFNGRKNFTGVKLPNTLKYIICGAFMNCSTLETVEPFLPASVIHIGWAAFNNCTKLTGDLVLTNPDLVMESSSPNDYGNTTFLNSAVTSLDFSQTKLTALPTHCFMHNKSLKWVKFPETYETFRSTFYNTQSLYELEFLGYPSSTIAGDVFYGSVAMPNGRVLYPAASAEWDVLIRASSFTDWASASGANKAAYVAKFPDGPEPIGSFTIGGSVKWAVPVVKASKDVKLSITGYDVGGSVVVCPGVVSPNYSSSQLVTESSITCTAPEYGGLDDYAYRCIGYKLGRLVDASIVYGDLVESRSYEFVKGDPGEYFLQWQWEKVGYRISFGDYPHELGDVAIAEATVPGVPGYYLFDTTIHLTATPANGVAFGTWMGDYPLATREQNPLEVVVDAPKTITPYFAKEWTFNDGMNSLSDGYWTLPVSGDRSALTLGKPANSPYAHNILDLRKGIAGGGAFASLPVNWLYKHGNVVEVWIPDSITMLPHSSLREIKTLEVVRLPETLTNISGAVFYQCSNLARIEPFLPDAVRHIGWAAFTSCGKLACDLVLRNRNLTMENGSNDSQTIFYESGILSADLSRTKLTQISYRCFRDGVNLSSVKLPKTLSSGFGAMFYNCRKLKDVWFLGSFITIPSDSFQYSISMPGGRVVYPKGDATWEAEIAARTAAGTFTTWENASVANRNSYLASFSDQWKPKGYTTIGGAVKWLVPHAFDDGLLILLK